MPTQILIADDREEDLLLAERVFRRCKILNRIIFLKTGEECLSYFRHHPEPALLFLDLRMTPVSGLEVLRELHKKKLGSRSIIVMLSGLDDMKAINEGYQLGAKTFLVKPLRSEDILDLLNLSLSSVLHVETTDEGHYLHWKHEPSA